MSSPQRGRRVTSDRVNSKRESSQSFRLRPSIAEILSSKGMRDTVREESDTLSVEFQFTSFFLPVPGSGPWLVDSGFSLLDA